MYTVITAFDYAVLQKLRPTGVFVIEFEAGTREEGLVDERTE